MTMGWHTVMEFTPSLIGWVIAGGNYSFDLVRKSRECVINLPTTSLTDIVVGVGNTTGAEVDKFEKFGPTSQAATRVKAPLIGECHGNFECRLADDAPVDKDNFFIFEVLKAHVAISPKHPETPHYTSDGVFMVAGDHQPAQAVPTGVARHMRGEWRRSRAAFAVLPDRDAELLCLVGEVVLDAGAREVQDADRQDGEHRVIAFERRCFRVLRPVRLEGDLRHLAVGHPLRGDEFGAPSAPRRAAAPCPGAWRLSSRSQIRRWSLKSSPPVRAIFGPGGSITWVSGRCFATRKSRLSIMAAVSVRWLTLDPERGR